jgi:dTDP-4-amino-4,6-dideoxygalactose transaminase
MILENEQEKKMKIPFLDLKSQYSSIRLEVNAAIQEVLDNTSYVLGRRVADFEIAFAERHKVHFCCGVSSGTDGNHLALWALGVGPGDEIIIPANTFIATAWGATLCGATPVFVDCTNDSYNIDPGKIASAITPKTKAIVAVHLYGQAADMDPIAAIARKYNLFLVEDCAQAHIAEYNGNPVGGFGITSSFSFYPGKNLGAYGEAGAVVTNDEKIALKFKMLRDHGALQKYNHIAFGHNYRMEGIQGAVLGVKLKYLNEWTDRRRTVAEKYRSLLSTVTQIALPKEMPYAKHVYHLFVIKVKDGKRDQLMNYLTENGVATGLHYPIPLHLQPCFSTLGYVRGQFPNAEDLASNGLSLPMYAELNDEQLNYITEKIKMFFR